MATSGSVNYTQNRNQILNYALQLTGVYGIGRTVSAEDMDVANTSLNLMVKAWQGQGIHLWAKEEGVLFVADNTGEYTLSSASGAAYATNWSDAVLTQLSAAEAASQTSISVDSSAGMAASDIVGIVLDAGTMHWSTISSVTDSTTIVIADALPSAASVNANVYTFTSRLNKPLKIHSMRRVTGVGTSSTAGTQVEVPLSMLSHEEFMDLSIKDLNGSPSQFYYNPDIENGKLYLWPRPDSPSTYIRFTYTRMLEDFDTASDNADFPVEWLECIAYQLALRLCVLFNKADRLEALAALASKLLENMLDWDQESGTIRFVYEG